MCFRNKQICSVPSHLVADVIWPNPAVFNAEIMTINSTASSMPAGNVHARLNGSTTTVYSGLVLTSRAAITSANHLFGQHAALYRSGQNSDETESTSDLLCYCTFLAIRKAVNFWEYFSLTTNQLHKVPASSVLKISACFKLVLKGLRNSKKYKNPARLHSNNTTGGIFLVFRVNGGWVVGWLVGCLVGWLNDRIDNNGITESTARVQASAQIVLFHLFIYQKFPTESIFFDPPSEIGHASATISERGIKISSSILLLIPREHST
uniref:Uncharacterized protein n=1 Tax=Glossina austeni TaxID=7395 RepID=A0A1A9V8M8_GLOAU